MILLSIFHTAPLSSRARFPPWFQNPPALQRLFLAHHTPAHRNESSNHSTYLVRPHARASMHQQWLSIVALLVDVAIIGLNKAPPPQTISVGRLNTKLMK